MLLPKPIWKDVPGYEGIYQVSNLGQVRSLKFGKKKRLKPQKGKDGYLYVGLCKNGKRKNCKVHRLVVLAFIPNFSNFPQVNHKDENKENNCVENLEWCTPAYNVNYGTRNERASKKVMCIETNKIFGSICEAERVTGVYKSNISKSCNGKRNTAGNLHWKYID